MTNVHTVSGQPIINIVVPFGGTIIICDVIKAHCYVVDIRQLILNKYFNTNMLTLLTACKTVVSSGQRPGPKRPSISCYWYATYSLKIHLWGTMCVLHFSAAWNLANFQLVAGNNFKPCCNTQNGMLQWYRSNSYVIFIVGMLGDTLHLWEYLSEFNSVLPSTSMVTPLNGRICTMY